jgi:hypothetical protein
MLAGRPGVSVSFLTTQAHDIGNAMSHEGIAVHQLDGQIVYGRPPIVTASVEEAVSDADIVLLTVPAHARAKLVAAIHRFIPADKSVFLGAIPANGGFDWLVRSIEPRKDNVITWGMGGVPWTARDVVPGKRVKLGGTRKMLEIAFGDGTRHADASWLKAIISGLFERPVRSAGSFIDLTLAPGNPVLHSGAVYGLIGPYSQHPDLMFDEPRFWWREISELGAYFIARVDAERRQIVNATSARLGRTLEAGRSQYDEIIASFGPMIHDDRTLLTVLRTNRAYQGKVPLVADGRGRFRFDPSSRAFVEDISFGLALWIRIAEALKIDVLYMSEIVDWSRSIGQAEYEIELPPLPADWTQTLPANPSIDLPGGEGTAAIRLVRENSK